MPRFQGNAGPHRKESLAIYPGALYTKFELKTGDLIKLTISYPAIIDRQPPVKPADFSGQSTLLQNPALGRHSSVHAGTLPAGTSFATDRIALLKPGNQLYAGAVPPYRIEKSERNRL